MLNIPKIAKESSGVEFTSWQKKLAKNDQTTRVVDSAIIYI